MGTVYGVLSTARIARLAYYSWTGGDAMEEFPIVPGKTARLFFDTHLELSPRTAGIDTIMIAGGSTEVGVASTAYSARDRDFNLILLRDVCTSGRPGVVDFFMDMVFPIFARVMTVDQAIASFDHSAVAAAKH